MQKVFNITNRYIVLATPLILYSLLASIYMAISVSSGKIFNLIFAILLFILMSAAFIAGWCYMIKSAVVEPDREDVNSLMGEFPAGVGEYFLTSLGGVIVISCFALLMIIFSYFTGMKFVGDPSISLEMFSNALQSTAALKSFLDGLSEQQLMQINLWNTLLLGFMTITYFLIFLYLPTMFFKNKNPFVAFWISFKDLFSKKFFKTLGLFCLIFIANFIISGFSTLFSGIIVMHFIMTLVNFYFITLVAVGIFYYYYNNFIKSGQNVDIKV